MSKPKEYKSYKNGDVRLQISPIHNGSRKFIEFWSYQDQDIRKASQLRTIARKLLQMADWMEE